MKADTAPQVTPMDQYNSVLVANLHPPERRNPEPSGRYDLVVIGAGTAGLVTAAGAAGLGARVALIEKHLLGGDCLNVGCVPSKCIIRSSRAVGDIRAAAEFGVHLNDGFEVNFPAVMERMRRLRSAMSYHDSVKRFQDLGVDVFLGEAQFTGPDSVVVGDKALHFTRAAIATGARAAELPIEGLKEAGYLTNETVFSLTERPGRLAVIGGGPLGSELAQAFHRLGSRVFIFQGPDHLLNREDEDAAEILQRAFLKEGIEIIVKTRPIKVTPTEQGKLITYERDGQLESLVVDEILLGVGRAPNVEQLNLEAAGVEYDRKDGVKVNDYLQTTNPRIYAAGDICLQYKFTHMADATARIVIQNALFMGRKKLSTLHIPWCTYTDPEIAHVGMYERDAREKGVPVDTFIRPMKEVDRAITDGEEEGFVKVHVKRGTDKILGATIVARHAGDMIGEISLAMVGGLGLKTIANVIHPYPTQAEAIRQVADEYNRTRLTPLAKSVLRLWLAGRRWNFPEKLRKYWDQLLTSPKDQRLSCMESGEKQMGAVIKASALVLFVITAVVIVRFTPVKGFLTAERLGNLLENAGYLAPLAFVIVYAAAVCLFVPGTLLTTLGAAIFGPYSGFIYVWVGAMFGASLAFFIGRYLGRDFAASLIGDRLMKYDEAVERNGFATVLYLRLVYFPFTPMNFGMGLTRVRFRDYFFGTALGIIVGTFIFTFFVGTVRDVWASGEWRGLVSWKVFFSLGLFAFSFFIPKIIDRIKAFRRADAG